MCKLKCLIGLHDYTYAERNNVIELEHVVMYSGYREYCACCGKSRETNRTTLPVWIPVSDSKKGYATDSTIRWGV